MTSISDKKDPRYEKLVEFFTSRSEWTTGVHGAEGSETYPDGPTIAEIAEAAEFGLGQPMRSWLRAWFDETKSQLESLMLSQYELAATQGQSTDWAAERVALWAQASIQRRIRNGISPPNAQETIDKKGSSVPLIDTGLFRSAIVSYFKGKQVTA